MIESRAPVRETGVDPETAALLIEAASVVGRPLDAGLRYRLIVRARAFATGANGKCGSAERAMPGPQNPLRR